MKSTVSPHGTDWTAVVTELKQCRARKDLQGGKRLHSIAMESGCDKDRYVQSALISMYSKCGSMKDAQEVFEKMIQRDAVCWTTLILGYVENGNASKALETFNCMDCLPDSVTFVAALKACAAMASENKLERESCLLKGRRVHRQARELGFEADLFVGNSLVNMYSKCGDMLQAQSVFNGMFRRDVVTWSSLILGYVENGDSLKALEVFRSMECKPDRISYVAALKACASLTGANKLNKASCLQTGRKLHAEIKECGFDRDIFIANTLVDMYCKCGAMQDARNVFQGMKRRDIISWNALVLGYVENGESSMALKVFRSIDCAPDTITFVAALKACAGLATGDKAGRNTLNEALSIHKQVNELGFEKNLCVANTLLDLYSKCGDMQLAKGVFDRLKHRDVVSYNALILGYVENKESMVALNVFNNMNCSPDRVTFLATLKACASLPRDRSSVEIGVSLHKQVAELGFEGDISVANSLMDMYSKFGDMHQALCIFNRIVHRDIVSWNTIILGFVENGESSRALEFFSSLTCSPDRTTFVAALKACTGLVSQGTLDSGTCLLKGMAVHRQAREFGFENDIFVANTLVDMYSKLGEMAKAREVFEGMKPRNVVSWTTLALGYHENGESSKALEVFHSMDCPPDNIMFVAALKACATLGALEAGLEIHGRVRELGLERDEMVGSCLVDFYGKCGNMTAAEDVFNRMRTENTVVWNALLGGYGSVGDTYQVFSLVKRMREYGVQMNGVTMLLVLRTCSHAGMVEEGKSYFEFMLRYGISPDIEHYTCMIDMLERANRLQEALPLLEVMPFAADNHVWMSLWSTCT